MEFTVLGTDIVQALDRIVKVTSKEPAKLVISSGKDKVVFLAEHESRFIRYPITAQIDTLFEPISIPVDRLKAACNKRGLMTFTVSHNSLAFKSKEGNSKGELFLKQFEHVEFPVYKFPKDSLVITKELIDYFTHVELSPDISQTDMVCFIDTIGKLKLVSANSNVAAILKCVNKLDVTPVSTCILINYINIFNSLFNKDEYQLVLSDSVIYAGCRGVTIKLPVFDPGTLSLEKVEEVVNEKKNTTSFDVNVEDFITAISRLKVAHSKGSPITLSIKKDMLTAGMESNFGKAFEALTVSNKKGKDGTAFVNFDMFNDIVNTLKASGGINIGFVDDSAVKVSIKNELFSLLYMVAAVGAD